MLKTLITVVICTYNRVDLLSICIKSLINQTADKNLFEILVVNNNSTDDTLKVVKKFKKNNTEIKLRIVNENKQGLSYARNRGWKEAKGKYIAYIDDDAIAGYDWIEKIMTFIERYPRVNIFGGPYDCYSFKLLPKWFPENKFILNLGDRVKRTDLKREWISGSNIIFNRNILIKYNGFNTNLGMKGNIILYGEETELLLRLKKMNEPIYYDPKIRVKHLIAERKIHLWWLLKNDYLSGMSYSYINKNIFNLISSIISLIVALLFIPIYIFDTRKGIIKRRLYYGLSDIFLSFGQIAAYINNSIKLINFYLFVFVFFTFIFIALFQIPILSDQEVLFYNGLIFLAITLLITSIISILLNRYYFKVSIESLIAAVLISISVNLSFFVIFPVTIDRSLTTYMLSTLNERTENQICHGLTEKSLEQLIINDYIKDKYAVRRRINEQSIINTLINSNSCIQLTEKGHIFLNFSKFIEKIYNIKTN